MKTKEKGNIGEAKTIAWLVSHGFNAAIPFGDNLPFDVIAVTTDYKLLKLQVKYGSVKKGVLSIKLENYHQNTKQSYTKSYTSSEVDFFVAYNPETGDVYFVPFEPVSQNKEFSIRFIKGRQKAKTNWYEDFSDLNKFLK